MVCGPAYQPGAALIQRRAQAHTSEAAPSRAVGRCGEETMPLYIALVTYTDRGMQAVRDSPRRLDQAKAQLAEMGGRFQAVYMTMGAHDLVFVYEAPDDAIAARFSLGLGMLGNVRSTTMKAFPEAAYREIIASLG
jgi:uncharacterized protein with GYD domain